MDHEAPSDCICPYSFTFVFANQYLFQLALNERRKCTLSLYYNLLFYDKL